MWSRSLPLLVVAFVIACSSSPGTGGEDGSVIREDGATPPGDGAVLPGDGGSTSDDGGGSTSDDGGGSTSDGGGGPAATYCRERCTAPADCASAAGGGLYDAAHYACDAGLCQWLGCSAGTAGDDECRAAFSRSSYVCRPIGGLRQCVVSCATASDCPAAATPAFDTDNYACVAGLCEYRGCNTDAECAATFSDARYVCRRATLPDTGLPIPTAERNCVLGCTTRTDCSTTSAAFDADNYECVETACVYRGCNTDTECASSFSSPDYVCR